MRFYAAVLALTLILPALSAGAQTPLQARLPPPTEDQIKAAAAMPFRDPALPIERRVDDLVSRMTLEEKVAQLIDRARPIPRLDVPAYNWWNEGLHGIARSGYATMFPQAIGDAATWDAPLIEHLSTVTSREARAKYNDAIRHGNHDRFYGLTIWSV
jgi:beta-glucosidase